MALTLQKCQLKRIKFQFNKCWEVHLWPCVPTVLVQEPDYSNIPCSSTTWFQSGSVCDALSMPGPVRNWFYLLVSPSVNLWFRLKNPWRSLDPLKHVFSRKMLVSTLWLVWIYQFFTRGKSFYLKEWMFNWLKRTDVVMICHQDLFTQQTCCELYSDKTPAQYNNFLPAADIPSLMEGMLQENWHRLQLIMLLWIWFCTQ